MPIMSNKQPMSRKPKTIIVIAGKFKEFDEFRRALRHNNNTYFYGDIKNLNGIEADEILKIGTWANRNDLPELLKRAEERVKKDGK